ncbi:MAG: flagellar motor switch protein FliN [Chitinispirillia bacterium]|nr:flagellar motor switch protein FliN [Chitinispirillia bacterium]MCL2242350.1 flagellar motor switch protein FliN [Chitinispirillia bacterium]
MSDFLSQDDIDALLNNLSDGGGDGGGGGGDDKRYKTLAPVLELFCKQASSVLSTAVFKTTDVVQASCAKADYAPVKEKLGGDILMLTLSLASGLKGDMYMLLRKSDAAVMADLMMGADGSAPYSGDTPDALSELFNQVMGAYATALGGDLGESVSAGNVTVAPFDMANPPFKADTADMVLAALKVEGMFESHTVVLIPNAFGDEIIDKKTPKASSGGMEMSVGISQDEMDALTQMTASSFGSAGGSSSSFGAPSSYAPPPPPPHRSSYDGPKENIDLLLDVELEVIIELGKSELSIKKILELAPGSIVELDRMAGEPVDLIVNNKIVARGEVVVVDENFGIRVVSLVSAEDRIKSLK